MINASARRARLAKLLVIGLLIKYANLWHLLALNQAAHCHQLRTFDLIALGAGYAWPGVTERSRYIDLCFPGEAIQYKHLTLFKLGAINKKKKGRKRESTRLRNHTDNKQILDEYEVFFFPYWKSFVGMDRVRVCACKSRPHLHSLVLVVKAISPNLL